MKFENYEYVRPNVEELKAKYEDFNAKLLGAKDYKNFLETFKEYNKLRDSVDSMSTLVYVRNTINTEDEYYDKEQSFWDDLLPEIESYSTKISKTIFNSPFKENLKEEIGEFYFNILECNLRTFNDEVLEDSKEENRLVTEYTKLTSSAKIYFDGEERNLSGMAKYTQDENSQTRIDANRAVANFFAENLEKYDEIYDKLVKVRTKIAKKLGFENFVELGYLRLNRIDYSSKETANYRKQIFNDIVPLVEKIKKDQAKRLGLANLNFQDEAVMFKSGNPTPKGDEQFLVSNAKKMYSELSKETGEFFDFMLERNLLDLATKKGKAGGGYCTYIPDHRAPFIFANFNGTPHDVEVLTHEAGHAFQVYRSRDVAVPEYVWPSYEACEIHSMSMEYLTWPWMDLFFKEETDKFKYYHLAGSLKFLPYGVTVDEFQHLVYENPDLTPKERREKWLEIEKKYLPSRCYDDVEELKNGMFFFRQGHIFAAPFYYIDYTLAQVCAFQFWKKANENREQAWTEYVTLCDQGGTKSFLDLVKVANLENPFEEGTIAKIVPELEKYLDSVDTSKF